MARDGLDPVAGRDLSLHLDGEAGQPRLGDDELGGADPDAVADGGFLFEGQALDSEVLAERAERQVLPELLPPQG
jgi:hypothetical protein